MDALKVEQLYIRRGSLLLQDISFTVEERAVCAIVGKGGSGKSTLIRGIGGALTPDAGRIWYGGRQMYEAEAKIREGMSLVYDEPNFNMELTPERLVREWLKFEPWFDRNYFDECMQKFELDPKLRVRLYSEGMQRKLMLILALCRRPQLLVMDEPTSGVDRDSRNKMWEMVFSFRRECPVTVLYTTHHEEEIAQADQVLWMENGCVRRQ